MFRKNFAVALVVAIATAPSVSSAQSEALGPDESKAVAAFLPGDPSLPPGSDPVEPCDRRHHEFEGPCGMAFFLSGAAKRMCLTRDRAGAFTRKQIVQIGGRQGAAVSGWSFTPGSREEMVLYRPGWRLTIGLRERPPSDAATLQAVTTLLASTHADALDRIVGATPETVGGLARGALRRIAEALRAQPLSGDCPDGSGDFGGIVEGDGTRLLVRIQCDEVGPLAAALAAAQARLAQDPAGFAAVQDRGAAFIVVPRTWDRPVELHTRVGRLTVAAGENARMTPDRVAAALDVDRAIAAVTACAPVAIRAIAAAQDGVTDAPFRRVTSLSPDSRLARTDSGTIWFCAAGDWSDARQGSHWAADAALTEGLKVGLDAAILAMDDPSADLRANALEAIRRVDETSTPPQRKALPRVDAETIRCGSVRGVRISARRHQPEELARIDPRHRARYAYEAAWTRVLATDGTRQVVFDAHHADTAAARRGAAEFVSALLQTSELTGRPAPAGARTSTPVAARAPVPEDAALARSTADRARSDACAAHLKRAFASLSANARLGDPVGTEGLAGFVGSNGPVFRLSDADGLRTLEVRLMPWSLFVETTNAYLALPERTQYCESITRGDGWVCRTADVFARSPQQGIEFTCDEGRVFVIETSPRPTLVPAEVLASVDVAELRAAVRAAMLPEMAAFVAARLSLRVTDFCELMSCVEATNYPDLGDFEATFHWKTPHARTGRDAPRWWEGRLRVCLAGDPLSSGPETRPNEFAILASAADPLRRLAAFATDAEAAAAVRAESSRAVATGNAARWVAETTFDVRTLDGVRCMLALYAVDPRQARSRSFRVEIAAVDGKRTAYLHGGVASPQEADAVLGVVVAALRSLRGK